MTAPVPARRRLTRLAVPLLCLSAALAGCSSTAQEAAPDESTVLGAATAAEMPFNSEFSRDGTYQSHTKVDGIDFVFNIWASKATPRMGEWYPKGDKYFSFTFQGYDTATPMRSAFARKRLVWLEKVQVTSTSTTASGRVETPYTLDAWAPDVTFDPEARTLGRKGMLITSPKGAFELRNQVIKDLADDTEGVTLTFRATAHVQERRNSKNYRSHEITLQIPVAIFASGTPTVPQPVPFNAS
ncbi:hypothetical protein [Nocardioides yefusunii]|uniref:Uncharacterized protein n=1 Tax=Nocardioides yefusunii TaxID=2500546 RepID=A0ABW1QWH9_9ACTN|nr:hypothetical protein [Nocardioides yefusunii]